MLEEHVVACEALIAAEALIVQIIFTFPHTLSFSEGAVVPTVCFNK